MDKTPLRAELIASLAVAFQRRLLHPGASTRDILGQYVVAVRVLRTLDPSGVCHEKIGDPARQYLRYAAMQRGMGTSSPHACRQPALTKKRAHAPMPAVANDVLVAGTVRTRCGQSSPR